MSNVLLPAELKLDIASRLLSVKDLWSLGQVSIVWSHAAFNFIYREVCLTNLGQNVQATINMFRNDRGSSRPVLSLTLLTLNPLHGHGTSSSLRAALNDHIPQWFQPTDFGQLAMLRGLEISGNPQMSPHDFEAFLRAMFLSCMHLEEIYINETYMYALGSGHWPVAPLNIPPSLKRS